MSDLEGLLTRLEQGLGAITDGPTVLVGGITNRNFRVSFAGRVCVVRLPGKDTSRLGISRGAEREANERAAALGLAPAVLAGDDECLVTEYVEGQPSDPDTLDVEGVAGALGAFHESGVRLPVRFWVPDLLDDYARVVSKLPARYEPAQRLARRIADVLPLIDPVPCHNDLLPANVLRTQRGPLLVDWEYAGMGHRVFDLGNLAVNCGFDAAAENRLLTAYYGRPPSPEQLAGLRLMRVMSDAREAAWGVVQGVISTLDFDFETYADDHFERLERAAAAPDFERQFELLAAHA